MELDSHATPPIDLLDCHQWEQILNDVGEDKYCAVIASPPWNVFSRPRGVVGEVTVLRTLGNEKYGVAGLSEVDKLFVKQQNYLASMTFQVLELCYRKQIPFGLVKSG